MAEERIVCGRNVDRNRSVNTDRSTAQVVLRWHLRRGVVAIPKTVHRRRIGENFGIGDFTLAAEDMAVIAAMDAGRSLILDWRVSSEVERLYDVECKMDDR